MKIELRRVSYNKRLSQETSAFAADIWIDGKKRGEVQNDGGGGCHMIHPYELVAEIEAYAKTLPPLPPMYGEAELPMCAELLIGELLEAHLAEKDLKRILKGKTLFTAANGKLYTVKGPAPRDAVQVLNTMAPAEALSLYLSASAK